MLSLQVRSGEYITIGDDIVVQVFRDGPVSRVAVKAPRELPILRGQVLERTDDRPDGLRDRLAKSPSRRGLNAAQQEKKVEKWAAKQEKRAQQASLLNELTEIAVRLDTLAAVHNDQETRQQLSELRARLAAVSNQ